MAEKRPATQQVIDAVNNRQAAAAIENLRKLKVDELLSVLHSQVKNIQNSPKSKKTDEDQLKQLRPASEDAVFHLIVRNKLESVMLYLVDRLDGKQLHALLLKQGREHLTAVHHLVLQGAYSLLNTSLQKQSLEQIASLVKLSMTEGKVECGGVNSSLSHSKLEKELVSKIKQELSHREVALGVRDILELNDSLVGKSTQIILKLENITSQQLFDILVWRVDEDTLIHHIVRAGLRDVIVNFLERLPYNYIESLCHVQGRRNMTILHLATDLQYSDLLQSILKHLEESSINLIIHTRHQIGELPLLPRIHVSSPSCTTTDLSQSRSSLHTTLIVKLQEDLMVGNVAQNVIDLSNDQEMQVQDKQKKVTELTAHCTSRLMLAILTWKGESWKMCLHEIVQSGEVSLIEILLREITDDQLHALARLKYRKGTSNGTLLHLSLHKKQVEVSSYLIGRLQRDNRKFYDLLLTKDDWFETPVHAAEQTGDTSIIKTVLTSLTNAQLAVLVKLRYTWSEMKGNRFQHGSLVRVCLRRNMLEMVPFLIGKLQTEDIFEIINMQDGSDNSTLIHTTIKQKRDDLTEDLLRRLDIPQIYQLIYTRTQVGGADGIKGAVIPHEVPDNVERNEALQMLTEKIHQIKMKTGLKRPPGNIKLLGHITRMKQNHVMAYLQRKTLFMKKNRNYLIWRKAEQDYSAMTIAAEIIKNIDQQGVDDTSACEYIQAQLSNLDGRLLQEVILWQDPNGKHLLHISAQNNMIKCFKTIAVYLTNNLYVELFSTVAVDFTTCLNWTVQHGWFEIVREAVKERFPKAEKDIKRLARVKDDQGNYTLGAFNASMSPELKLLLEPMYAEHLTSAYDPKLAKICLLFDNSELCNLMTRHNYDKHAWARVGVKAQTHPNWSKEELLTRITAVASDREHTLGLLIVGVLATGQAGFIEDKTNSRLTIEEIVRHMEKNLGSVPKVLIVESMTSSTRSQTQMACNIRSLNFTLITYLPKEPMKSNQQSYLSTLSDALMSVLGRQGVSVSKLFSMATDRLQQNSERDIMEMPLFESTLCKTIILRNPQVTRTVVHDCFGNLISGGHQSNNRLKLVDYDGKEFYPEIYTEVASLCITDGILMCLTHEGIKEGTYMFHVHTVNMKTREINRAVIKFQSRYFEASIMATQQTIFICTAEGIRVYSYQFDLLATNKDLKNPYQVIPIDDRRFIIASTRNSVYGLSVSDQLVFKEDWKVDAKHSIFIRGIAFSELLDVVGVLCSGAHGRSSIYFFSKTGEFKYPHHLKGCDCDNLSLSCHVSDISIYKDEVVIAHGQHGHDIYRITQSANSDRPLFKHWSSFDAVNE